MTDYKTLATEAIELLDDEDAYTWMDADPDVAWDDPESQHGRLGSLLEEAGWERCWHERNAWHYNVKLRGNASYRAMRDTINEYTDGRENAREIETDLEKRIDNIHDGELEAWWTWQLPEELRQVTESVDTPKVYSCGRQAGYVNIPRTRSYLAPDLIRLAEFLQGSVDYYDSAEYGQWLADEAIEARQDSVMRELASERIERVEA